MIFISFLRAIKFSFQDIFRNFWLSITTIIILLLALFSINLLLTVQIVSDTAISAVKEKIDINIYLNNNADEKEILALKSKISNFIQVKEITYISKEEALNKFKEKHKNSPDIMQSINELDKNPLSPTLIIKPVSIDVYDELISKLNKLEEPIIESRDFTDHKSLLNKINAISAKVNEAGLGVSIVFIIINLLVVFNAIRVAIYSHRREIKIMRLVGASKWFIRLPYIISSILYTIIGMSIIIPLFYFFLTLLQPYLEAFFVGYNINIIKYFNSHFIIIFGMQFLIGTLVNILASLVAIRNYSKA